jgi:hypothetical protein
MPRAPSTFLSPDRSAPRSGARGRVARAFVLGVLGLLLLTPLRAIIFYSTADPGYNTTAPTGSLADSGWQWVGNWNGFQGTPIGPKHFITARHIGGTVGDVLVLNGVSYPTVAVFDDTLSDLRIYEISGTFPSWAPLYRGAAETGRTLVVFGRGWKRGAEVFNTAGALRGWQWSPADGLLRWGKNTVAGTTTSSYWGELLTAAFNSTGGADEAHLAIGDSSAPVFINDGTGWKLAGIAATVDGLFNTTNTGAGFNAAIFDARGLYFGNSSNWTLIPLTQAVTPSGFYATRVSVRTGWIDGILSQVVVNPPVAAVGVPVFTPLWTAALVVLLVAGGARALAPVRNRVHPTRILPTNRL